MVWTQGGLLLSADLRGDHLGLVGHSDGAGSDPSSGLRQGQGPARRGSSARFEMAQMSAGDVCFVNYSEVPHTVRVRLLGCHISQNLWAIITPDIYEEEMSPGNGDFVDFTYGGGGLAGGIPPGINPAHVYGFGVMSAAEYQQLMAQARIYAAAIRVSMGLPAVPDPPVPG